MNREERLEIVNKIIKKISTLGRNFFYYEEDKTTAKFLIKNNRIYFMDDYSKKEFLTYNYRQLKSRHFSHGGTLTSLILDMSEWIRTGKQTNGKNGYSGLYCQHWGYPEEDMKEIQEYAKSLGYLK